MKKMKQPVAEKRTEAYTSITKGLFHPINGLNKFRTEKHKFNFFGIPIWGIIDPCSEDDDAPAVSLAVEVANWRVIADINVEPILQRR